MNEPESETVLGTDRVEALVDGIFAFAMTLLVLGIDIPEKLPSIDTNQAILQHLVSLIPQFFVYALAFFTLGAFWYTHQKQFSHIRHVDGWLLWNNILCMMFIALIPFTTNLAGDYGDSQMGILPMEVNLLIVSLIFYSQLAYITAHAELLHQHPDSLSISRGRERILAMIYLSLIAIGLSFFIPAWSAVPYFLMPFIPLRERLGMRPKQK